VKVQELQLRIPALEAALDGVAAAEADCNFANVEENDYTIFTCQDLQFELELAVHSIQKKITFIENQVSLTLSKEHSFANVGLDRFKEYDKHDACATGRIREHFSVFR
jgi:hypothetical protein